MIFEKNITRCETSASDFKQLKLIIIFWYLFKMFFVLNAQWFSSFSFQIFFFLIPAILFNQAFLKFKHNVAKKSRFNFNRIYHFAFEHRQIKIQTCVLSFYIFHVKFERARKEKQAYSSQIASTRFDTSISIKCFFDYLLSLENKNHFKCFCWNWKISFDYCKRFIFDHTTLLFVQFKCFYIHDEWYDEENDH